MHKAVKKTNPSLLFEKLKNIYKFSADINVDQFNQHYERIDVYLQKKYKQKYFEKHMSKWIPLLTYIKFKYNDSFNKKKIVIGLQGPQGSGKTTISQIVCDYLKEIQNVQAETISIDDFYMTFKERNDRGIHFRGPPGTHDMQLMHSFFESFQNSDSEGMFSILWIMFLFWKLKIFDLFFIEEYIFSPIMKDKVYEGQNNELIFLSIH